MLRMELFESLMLRSVFLSIGYLGAMYMAYHIKLSKKTVLDAVLVLFVIYVAGLQVETILVKLILYVVFGYGLLVFRYKKNRYGSLLFSLVIVLMAVVGEPLALGVLAMSNCMLHAIALQESSVCGALAMIVPSVIMMFAYFFAGYVMRKYVDVDHRKSKRTYELFALFYMFILIQIGLVLEHFIAHIDPSIGLRQMFLFIGFLYTPIMLIVFFSVYYLITLLAWEKLINIREDELLISEQKRREGYRANHNVDSIILTIHTLAKNEQYDELNEYVAKLG